MRKSGADHLVVQRGFGDGDGAFTAARASLLALMPLGTAGWRGAAVASGAVLFMRSRLSAISVGPSGSTRESCTDTREDLEFCGLRYRVGGPQGIDHQFGAVRRDPDVTPLSGVWISSSSARRAPQADRGGDGDRTGGALVAPPDLFGG